MKKKSERDSSKSTPATFIKYVSDNFPLVINFKSTAHNARVDDVYQISRQIVAWEEVLAAYLRDFQAGVFAYVSKNNACEFCVAYGWCRQCPVVRETHCSCWKLRERAGFGETWYLHEAQAYYVVAHTILFFKKLLKKMEAPKNG